MIIDSAVIKNGFWVASAEASPEISAIGVPLISTNFSAGTDDFRVIFSLCGASIENAPSASAMVTVLRCSDSTEISAYGTGFRMSVEAVGLADACSVCEVSVPSPRVPASACAAACAATGVGVAVSPLTTNP